MPTRPKKAYQSNWGNKGSYLDRDVQIKPVPAPVAGWDQISPLAAMDPKYANIMTNWTPRPGWIEIRGGYNAWNQGLGGAVNSLMVYRPNNNLEKMFAASGATIYDVSVYGTTAGIAAPSNGVYLSDKWQYCNFTPAGGSNYLLAVNGSDNYLAFNGTSWTSPVITGVAGTSLFNITVFKRRVWFVQKNSTSAWFTTTDGIQGALTQLDVGAFMDRGGYLVAVADWTVDGGMGPQDLALFITSEGQVVVYQGTDPTNANAWSLVGVFNLPPPIGTRCYAKLGSDVILITLEGLIPMSQVLPFDPSAARNVSLTNRIQNAFIQSAINYQANFGWQVLPFRQQNLFFCNIPQVANSTQVQYVMNALTGAWTQYTGWNANCFEIFNDSLYFGDNKGNINLAYTGGLDLVNPILADVRCAFNYFDEPGKLKNATMVRPFLVADGTITPTIEVDADFAVSSPAAAVSILTPSGAVWDASLWDSSIWSLGSGPVINWLSASALGTALAIRMTVNLQGGTSGQSAAQTQSVFDIGTFDHMLFDGNGNITASGLGIPTLQLTLLEIALKFGGPV